MEFSFTIVLFLIISDLSFIHNQLLKERVNKKKNLDDIQTDALVDEILTWIQKNYVDKDRKARQEYINERKPRPFQNIDNDYSKTGYPSSGYVPVIPFNEVSTKKADYIKSLDLDEANETPNLIRTTERGPIKVSLNNRINSSGLNSQIQSASDLDDPNYLINQSADDKNNGNDDIENHPPHIHKISGQCSKDMMIVNLEFNKVFNGIVYSKGFLDQEECRFVNPNSNDMYFKFAIEVNKCGTTFNDKFDTDDVSYLENTLIFQNEPNVQEEWDYIRSIRCLLKRNFTQELNSQLSLAMLKNDVLNFSGDTAMVYLDIKQGNDPLVAPTDNSQVRIGENMTLTLTLIGDNEFDIFVKKCRATNANSSYSLDITDDNGCILKPKFFGTFQTQQNPNKNLNEYSIVKYSFFKAFKFPDSSDVQFDCNIELCKTNCQDSQCPNQDQKYPVNRKKRQTTNIIHIGNIRKSIRVIVPFENNLFTKDFTNISIE